MTAENQVKPTDVDKALRHRHVPKPRRAEALRRAARRDHAGVVKITSMIRSGITFDIAGAILIIILLPLMVSLLGLGG